MGRFPGYNLTQRAHIYFFFFFFFFFNYIIGTKFFLSENLILVLYCFSVSYFFLSPAKRSRHVADTPRTNKKAEVEETLFDTVVRKAGLRVNSGLVQDVLGIRIYVLTL